MERVVGKILIELLYKLISRSSLLIGEYLIAQLVARNRELWGSDS